MGQTELVNIGRTPQLTLLYCGHAKLAHWRAINVRVPYWRLYWNNRAGAQLLAPDGVRHRIAPPWFTLVAPNTMLSRELSRPVEHFFTHFSAGPEFDHIQARVHQFTAPENLLAAMRRDYALTTKATPAQNMPRRSVTALALCWYALSTLPAELLVDALPNPRLKTLLRWWETRDWRAMSNQELAAHMGMHPTAFCRYFRRETGYPPHTFGLMKRIDRACLLLHFSHGSIKQIAENTGFCDRYYFSRVFQRLRGVSPAKFRHQHIPSA